MNNENNAVIIGITGGIASGKTAVAKIIESEGYPVIYSDKSSKYLLENDEDIKSKIVASLGSESFKSNGEPNTEFIAKSIFSDDENSRKLLEKVNSIIHPRVIEMMVARLEELVSEGKELIFVESALMFETGISEGYDYIISVYLPIEMAAERAKIYRDVRIEDFYARAKSQLNPETKRDLADFVIDNTGDMDKLKKSVLALLDIITILPQNISKFEEDGEE